MGGFVSLGICFGDAIAELPYVTENAEVEAGA